MIPGCSHQHIEHRGWTCSTQLNMYIGERILFVRTAVRSSSVSDLSMSLSPAASTMSFASDTTLEWGAPVLAPPPLRNDTPPPMPEQSGPPTPSGSPPPMPPSLRRVPDALRTIGELVGERRMVLWQPCGMPAVAVGEATHVPVLPFADVPYSDCSDDEEVLSDMGSSIQSDRDDTDNFELDPYGFLTNVLDVWGPDPLAFSQCILRRGGYVHTGSFWDHYPHRVFTTADPEAWQAYLTEAGMQRNYLRRYWLERREYAYDIIPPAFYEETGELNSVKNVTFSLEKFQFWEYTTCDCRSVFRYAASKNQTIMITENNLSAITEVSGARFGAWRPPN